MIRFRIPIEVLLATAIVLALLLTALGLAGSATSRDAAKDEAKATYQGTTSGTLTFSNDIASTTYNILPPGETCPAERPVKRKVVAWGTITCNLNLVYRLTCPSDTSQPCVYLVSSTCPPPATHDVCFTQDEIDKATK